ncbi:MAG: sulfatase [Vicinamibacteria bacterium]|nr:sulfatase [Vicinamibacteria bacterium]
MLLAGVTLLNTHGNLAQENSLGNISANRGIRVSGREVWTGSFWRRTNQALVLCLALAAALGATGCGQRPGPLDLLRSSERLEEARVAGRTMEWISAQIGRSVRIHDDVRFTLPSLPPSRYVYRVDVPRGAQLTFACGIGADHHKQPGVEFTVKARRREREEVVWTSVLDPLTQPRHRRWVDVEADLSRFAGRDVTLTFETQGYETSDAPDRAYWAAPAITVERPAPLSIVFLVDALRADHTNPYGYERDTTPELTRFAEDAVVFEHAISHASWTKPSVASLFTSLLPGKHHVIQLNDSLQAGHLTLAEALWNKGFTTGAVIANSVIYSEGTLFEQGFDFYRGVHGARDRPSKIVKAAPLMDTALDWLDTRRGLPAFLYVHTMDSHVPYKPLPPFDRKFEPHPLPNRPAADPRVDYQEPEDRERLVAQYDGEIAYGDREFGRFMRGLQERGLYERALIVFQSDHGEEFQDHGQWLHGRSVFDELVRVPLIVKFPGNRDAGRRVAQQVQVVDIYPTVLEEMGLPVPSSPAIIGRPLSSVIRGQAPDIPAVSEISHRGNVAYGMRAGKDKYIERFSPKSDELYFDLLRDPREQQNRIGKSAERARFLKAGVQAAMIANPFRTNIRFVGKGAFDVTLTSQGWIEGLRATGFGPRDQHETEERLRTRIRIAPSSGATREASFTVRPIGAPVGIEGAIDGRPIQARQIHIAREGVHPEGAPPFLLPEIESEKNRVENIFAPPESATPGLHIWLTLNSEHTIMGPMDCETCRRMEALGYVSGCDCP